MKKSMLIVSMLCFGLLTSNLWAEDSKDEALQSLSSAQTMIKQGSISKAVEEINYALSKLNEVQADLMLTFIPAAPAGFSLESKNAQGMGQGVAMVGNAGAEGRYTGPNDASVKVTIATGGVSGKMGSLASFGSMFAGMSQGGGGGFKSVRIQGYTGTLQFDAENSSGTLTLQVGEKTSVTIEGNNISSESVLKSFAEKMNLSKLATSF